MAVTTLDPKTTLIVIDLQKSIAGRPTVHPASGIIQNAAQLAATFRSRNLPVILVNVNAAAPGRTEQQPNFSDLQPDWTDLVPELNRQPSDITVTKRTWGAFSHTNLAQILKDLGVTQVVICGISTSIGVESTARQAYESGLNVTIALDATTDTNPDAFLNSAMRIFPRLGETGATQEIIDLLK